MKGKRRRWRRWLIFPPLLVVGLFGLLQLLLRTPWACRSVAGRIESATGLETGIGHLSWSPWGGAVAHGLRVAKPAGLGDVPLIAVRQVRVWPDYGAWLRGRAGIRGLELEEPEIELNAELLLSLASQALAAAPEPPALAARERLPEPPAASLAGGGEATEPAGTGPEAPPPPLAVRAKPDEATWLILRRASLRLVSTGQEWIRVEDLDGAIPLTGAGRGEVTGNAEIRFDHSIQSSVYLRFSRAASGVTGATLKLSEKRIQVFGNVMIGEAQGSPFQTKASIVSSEWIPWHFGSDWSGELGPLGWMAEGAGWLAYPRSWRGRSEWKGDGLRVSGAGMGADFGEVAGRVDLSGGRLHCPEARLVGGAVSLLGNGWLGRGSGAGVVRATLPSGMAAALGSRSGPVAWKALEPSGRRYADLTVWSAAEGRWRVELGEGGPQWEWEEWTRRLRSGSQLGR